MERLKYPLCPLTGQPVAISRPGLAVTSMANAGWLWGTTIRNPEPRPDVRITSEAVKDARGEGMRSDHPAGDEAIQGRLDDQLVPPHPPVRNSPSGIHRGLVLKQEEDDFPGEGVRANCGFNQGCHNFRRRALRAKHLTTKAPRHHRAFPPLAGLAIELQYQG